MILGWAKIDSEDRNELKEVSPALLPSFFSVIKKLTNLRAKISSRYCIVLLEETEADHL
jgi:hypothetical protein